MSDLYAELGVERGASAAEIKKIYRRLAKELHPDRNRGNKSKEERFKKVSAAYQVLSDEKKRKLYDEFGQAGLREGFDPEMARQQPSWGPGGPGGSGGFNIEDLFGGGFQDFFQREPSPRRRRRRSSQGGGDFESSISLPLGDAVRGCEREFTFQMPGGDRTLRVRIPAGVADGGKIRLKGQGAGQPPGDLLLRIQIQPHPHYWREAEDLHLRLPVTPAEAYRGASVEVPTFSGAVSLKVPAGAKGGAKLRLRGKGIAANRKDARTGDLIVHLSIVLPAGDDPAVGKLLDELQEKFAGDPRAGIEL